MKARKRKAAPRHRSPVAPPSRIITQKGYRRSEERKKVRRQIDQETSQLGSSCTGAGAG